MVIFHVQMDRIWNLSQVHVSLSKKSQKLRENGQNLKVFWVYLMADYIGGLPIMIGRLIGIGRTLGNYKLQQSLLYVTLTQRP